VGFSLLESEKRGENKEEEEGRNEKKKKLGQGIVLSAFKPKSVKVIRT